MIVSEWNIFYFLILLHFLSWEDLHWKDSLYIAYLCMILAICLHFYSEFNYYSLETSHVMLKKESFFYNHKKQKSILLFSNEWVSLA